MTHHPAAIFVPSPAALRQSWPTAAIVLAWASFCWMLGELWLASNVAAPLIPSIALAWFGAGLALGGLAFSLAGVAAIARHGGRTRTLFSAAAVPFLVLFGVWLTNANDLALRARFSASDGDLNAIADLAAGGQEPMPAFGTLDGGWFTVRAVDQSDGCIRLTTNVDGDVTAGLARCTVDVPQASGLAFRHLSGDWWVWRSE